MDIDAKKLKGIGFNYKKTIMRNQVVYENGKGHQIVLADDFAVVFILSGHPDGKKWVYGGQKEVLFKDIKTFEILVRKLKSKKILATVRESRIRKIANSLIAKEESFGGSGFNFSGAEETLEEVFGKKDLTNPEAIKKFFDHAKKKGWFKSSSVEEELINRSFVPSRKDVKEETVREIVTSMCGCDDDVDTAINVPGSVLTVGGDVRLNEPPYIFQFSEEDGFVDNIVEE